MFRAWIFCLLSAMAHAQTCACTIPVFRYALDRWEPDRLSLTIPASDAAAPALVDLLRPLRANGSANLDIKTSADPALKSAELRDSRSAGQVVWSGTLDQTTLGSLLDSPGRQAILSRILSGESVVWVLVDGGGPGDAAEIDRIEKRLKFLEQVAALPVQDPNDPDSQLGPGPALRLQFGTLRLRSADPAEQVLLRMLAGPETGAGTPTGQGFAAAVFGRGRVLGSWPLARLDDAALEDACMFLVGRCSCRVKNQNPGWDLLLNVNWEAALKTAQAARQAPVENAPPAAAQPVVVTTVAAAPASAGEDPTGVPQSWILLTSTGILLAGVAVLLLKNKA